jgi:hypothetical protein
MNDKLNALVKGYKERKYLKKLKDGMTFELLLSFLNSYKYIIVEQNKINISLKKKKTRMINFPESISENIVKFAIFKKYKIMPNWDIKPGDLEIDLITKVIKVEVKGALDLNNGPATFGSKENWDIIYFVDGKLIHENKFTVYEIKLSNKSKMWKNLEVSKYVYWKTFIKTGKRPRMNFLQIKNQLPDIYINKIFEGHINELNPEI